MDYDEVMERVWQNGSYERQAPDYLSMAARLAEAAGIEAGDRVLDVGTGTGNVAVTAARRGASVVGVDITPDMLERARANAEIAGVGPDAEFREGDAADLPFEDDSFDVVTSALGHMYAEDHAASARELARVTRPGGTVAFTSWTPPSLFPFMAGVLVTYLDGEDLPEMPDPPFMWGDSSVVEDYLGESVSECSFEQRTVSVPALSPAHYWEETKVHSGVFAEFVGRVDEADRPALREEMVATIESHFDDEENAVELDYLLTTAEVGR